jgi:type I restriction enzyme R subunit
LVQAVRRNVTIDWTVRESVRAKLRVLVRRVLRKHGYPPDKQERATQTVLEQAERLAERVGGVVGCGIAVIDISNALEGIPR